MNPVLDVREYAGSTFPLTVPDAGTFLLDPVAVGLANFIAFWLNKDLNPHLARIPPHSATAVPTGRQFPYDPQGFWVRNSNPNSPTTPAQPQLYVWWEGSRAANYTNLLEGSLSTYNVLYIGEEVVAPAGLLHYTGIGPLVARSMNNAFDACVHADYGYNGDPLGTPIWRSLQVRGLRLTETTPGALVPRPATNAAAGGQGEGGIVRFFPAVQAVVMVHETIGQPVPRESTAIPGGGGTLYPSNVMGDSVLNIRTEENGDIDNAVEIMVRNVPGPDGTEQDE